MGGGGSKTKTVTPAPAASGVVKGPKVEAAGATPPGAPTKSARRSGRPSNRPPPPDGDYTSTHIWSHPDVPEPYDPEECDECGVEGSEYVPAHNMHKQQDILPPVLHRWKSFTETMHSFRTHRRIISRIVKFFFVVSSKSFTCVMTMRCMTM